MIWGAAKVKATDAHFPALVANLPPHDADSMDVLELKRP